jgi:hypothetical protein
MPQPKSATLTGSVPSMTSASTSKRSACIAGSCQPTPRDESGPCSESQSLYVSVIAASVGSTSLMERGA